MLTSVQTDIQYWDDQLTEELENIQASMDRIPDLKGMDKASALDKSQKQLRSAKGSKRSFKMEIRLIQDVGMRKEYEARLQRLDQQLRTLQQDYKALETENERGQLFVQSNGNDNVEESMDGVKAGDNMLKEASALQDKTQDSLANTKQLIAQSKEVGVSTLEELERQRNVIGSINNEVDRIDDNLARAEKLIKQFGKRMATDTLIHCFAVVNCLLLVGVVLYAVLKKGGLPKVNDTSPDDPIRFMLRKG